jgi:hypothetical protein
MAPRQFVMAGLIPAVHAATLTTSSKINQRLLQTRAFEF